MAEFFTAGRDADQHEHTIRESQPTRKCVVMAVAMVGALCGVAAADDTVFHHPETVWWLGADLDALATAQPGFHAPYAGSQSFASDDHVAGSYLASVFADVAPTSTTTLVASGESTAGQVLGGGHGLAAALDDDLTRDPTRGPVPFLGRAYVEQVIPLSAEREPAHRSKLQLHDERSPRRIEIRAGRLWAPDLVELAPPAFRSAMIRHGSWDYPADDRGYTLGVAIAYVAPLWRLQIAELAMPSTPRGGSFDSDIARARSDLAALSVHDCLAGLPGSIVVLAYQNAADMGSYGDAIAAFRIGEDDVPDATKYRRAGTVKRGVAATVTQTLPGDLDAFVGAGIAGGDAEAFGTTEADDDLRAGIELRGRSWRRAGDRTGIGFASSGLAALHRTYLELGGTGTLLGDGKLHYGREDLMEAYYAADVARGVTAAIRFDLVAHPGFNTDRGPLVVGSFAFAISL